MGYTTFFDASDIADSIFAAYFDGNTTDASPNANANVNLGSSQIFQSDVPAAILGNQSQSLRYPDVNAFVTYDSIAAYGGMNALTIAMWIKVPVASTNAYTLVVKNWRFDTHTAPFLTFAFLNLSSITPSNDYALLADHSGVNTLGQWDDVSGGVIDSGIWKHLAAVWDKDANSGFALFYEGGNLETRDSGSARTTVISNVSGTNPGPLGIAAETIAAGAFDTFPCNIAEVVIWPRALSQAELAGSGVAVAGGGQKVGGILIDGKAGKKIAA